MEFGKKLLIGALCLIVGGEYALYKNFEDSPNTLQEMAKWPFNEEYAKFDELLKEYNQFKELPLEKTIGEISETSKIELEYGPCKDTIYTFNLSAQLIKMRDSKRFMYVKELIAVKGDKVSFNHVSIPEIKKRNEFIEKVIKFREQNDIFRSFTIGMDLYPYKNIDAVVKSIPPERLNELDGIIESYEVLK